MGDKDTEELSLLRDLFPGFSARELLRLQFTCRRLGLDPFARQVYLLKLRRKVGGRVLEVAEVGISIGGLRAIASRSGKYAGQLGPEWAASDGKWRDVWLQPGHPAAARVGVLRSDFQAPIWGVARWESYCPTDERGRPLGLWGRMPDLLLGKVAEALALRRAFPETSSVYTPEELSAAQREALGEPLPEGEELEREERELKEGEELEREALGEPLPERVAEGLRRLGAASSAEELSRLLRRAEESSHPEVKAHLQLLREAAARREEELEREERELKEGE